MNDRHPHALPRELMVLRVVRELRDGMVVNYGSYADTSTADPDTINPGGARVTLRPGASFFNSAESFALVRGGHVDVAVLGAMQVAENGDLANWMVPERGVGGIGGAMDLAVGAKRVIAVMEHTTREGHPKLVRQCTYPLTARRVVGTVVTDLAVIEVAGDRFVLREHAPGVTVEEIRARTDAELDIAEDLTEMTF